MDEFFVNIAIQVAMMVLTGVAGWFGGRVREAAKERNERNASELKERDGNRAILRLLLYYRLKDLFAQYVINGMPITSADKHEVEEIYSHYHDRGGNGEGTRMYREIMNKQVKG